MEKIIFVSYISGAGGHRFSRVICCLPTVHWYSSVENGINPWNISNPITDKRKASKYDFDTPWTMLKQCKELLPVEFIGEYKGDTITWDWFKKEFVSKSVWTVIPTHRSPEDLIKHYPESKIFHLHNTLDVCTERSAEVSGKYMVKDCSAGFETKQFISPTDRNMHYTYRDMWALERFNSYYQPWHKKPFTDYIRSYIEPIHTIRKNKKIGFQVDMTKRIDWKGVKEYING